MTKRLFCILAAVVLLCCGCAKEDGRRVSGEDTKLVSRLENTAELQKSIFVADILSTSVENAVITKYNIDLSKYTVYTVDITKSFDGFTPTGRAKLYCVGTSAEFMSRINLKKGERYIIDAQPWVYGGEIVYLLSVYTTAYPRVDTAQMVTLAQSETEALSCGSLSEYEAQYEAAKAAVEARVPDFFEPQNILSRFGETVSEIKTKNTDPSAYGKERGYEWIPGDEFIAQTAQKSEALFERYSEFAAGTHTAAEAYEFINSALSGNF